MRILITNERLDQRGGSDLFERDLARELNRRRHSVIAYSSALSERERSLERDFIPVATDLEHLPLQPDLIHARHHLDAMSALMALADVPAIYQCPGPIRLEMLPRHPRLFKYVVPSGAVARMLSGAGGIDESSIEVLLGAVDLARFSTIRAPAQTPKRALAYDAHLGRDSAILEQIRTAATEFGLEFDVIGRRAGFEVDNPEARLPAYDVVFATSRSAIEALACGCAVIVLGEAGCGEMVREDNFERLRQADFCATQSVPHSAAEIRGELERYSASSCATLAMTVRREADFVHYVEKLESVYRAAIAMHGRHEADLDVEQRSASNYLKQLTPVVKEMDRLQKKEAVSFATANILIDVRSKVAALQAELGKPNW